jgi:undecaprenyl-diphosphatase
MCSIIFAAEKFVPIFLKHSDPILHVGPTAAENSKTGASTPRQVSREPQAGGAMVRILLLCVSPESTGESTGADHRKNRNPGDQKVRNRMSGRLEQIDNARSARATSEPRRTGGALIQLLREVGPFAILGLVGALVLMFVFAALAEDVFTNEITSVDNNTSLWVRSFSSPLLDTVFSGLSTYVGIVGVVAALVIVFGLLLWRKRPYEAWRLVLVMAGGMILNEALKLLFHRSRPDLWPGSQLAGFSFPSGHAMMSFCLFGMLAWLAWRYLRNQAARIAVTVLCTLLIVLVGLSRIYLGAHYLSDVIAGYIAAAFWLVAVPSGTSIFARLRAERHHPQSTRGL